MTTTQSVQSRERHTIKGRQGEFRFHSWGQDRLSVWLYGPLKQTREDGYVPANNAEFVAVRFDKVSPPPRREGTPRQKPAR